MKTEHLVTRTFFSVSPTLTITCACVWLKGLTAQFWDVLHLCASLKSSTHNMFHRPLFGVPDPFPSFCSTPPSVYTDSCAYDWNQEIPLRHSARRITVWPSGRIHSSHKSNSNSIFQSSWSAPRLKSRCLPCCDLFLTRTASIFQESASEHVMARRQSIRIHRARITVAMGLSWAPERERRQHKRALTWPSPSSLRMGVRAMLNMQFRGPHHLRALQTTATDTVIAGEADDPYLEHRPQNERLRTRTNTTGKGRQRRVNAAEESRGSTCDSPGSGV